MPVSSTLANVHGANATAYKQPPLDGSLTVPEIYDWHLQHNPDHVVFVYATEAGDRAEITFKQGVHAMHRAGRMLIDRLSNRGLEPKPQEAPVIAIFAATDTITYFATWIGLVRAGYVVCHLSHRNSAVAVADLLQKVNTAHVLVSSEPRIQAVVREALDTIHDPHKTYSNFVSEMPAHQDIFIAGDDYLLPRRELRMNSPAFFIHSSGSTAFPKPLVWTHDTWITLANPILSSHTDLCGEILGCQAVPMFHAMGIFTTMLVAGCGMTVAAFKPQTPAIAVTPESTFESIINTGCTYTLSAPYIVETWARDPSKITALKGLKGVMSGGGPFDKGLGDLLVDHGLNIYNIYGSSETGLQVPLISAPAGKDWDYLPIIPTCQPEFVPHGDGTYELILVKCKTSIPLVLNTKWNGTDAYATNDLLVPHPTKEGHWKIVGRADDQIMLSTGEKTNPGPLEAILRKDPRIQIALMFGRGRFQNGVIILPKPEHSFDPANQELLIAFRNAIWPTVEQMNAYAPQHSRLFKEMILVASPDKPFLYTPKGSIRRQATLNEYEAEIEALYTSIEESSQSDIAAPTEWNSESTLDFVRKTVHTVLKAAITDEDDLFQYGCDSLQATWIRNTVARALRDSGEVTAPPFDLVYVYPTISSLAKFVMEIDSSVDNAGTTQARKTDEMLALVDKYLLDLPAHSGTYVYDPNSGGYVVLLTGTTGGLGSSILAGLLASPRVRKVYAPNRRSSKGRSLKERQKDAFVARGLDEGLLESPRLILLESDFASPELGLDAATFREMHDSVTTIIHNAYPVNFNLSLASFEPQIAIVRRFVDFALTSRLATPPSIVFTSSVSTLRNLPLDQPAEEIIFENPASALGAGYSESKWVAEMILSKAASVIPALHTTVVRVGQLSGGKTGDWNAAEWFPSLVASGVVVKCLPDIDTVAAWVPLDIAASAMVEISLNHEDSVPPLVHLAHPHPVTWSSIVGYIAEQLGVPLVTYADWLQALDNDLKDKSQSEVEHMQANPALRLLSFYKGASAISGAPKDNAHEAMGMPLMATEKARAAARFLNELAPLAPSDIDKWLAYWRRVGALPG
ncbi:acetyl-CoA synthetase-like protein [Punctularia strigosozonata HHB-11173 SS5]|uniref:Acetyl-CoA synthetase-like protein n=1 Tax=Punctularia strigosozonata (strain HHB-11173) TaxID=741275 RepID=R7S3H0_PUNST|nr:acetyl-CoA synthetase-like protein [Punctularia strigosozonata HHB-11173 SS5]EIN04342.1 acetyl-CoA synthetase-like protein [Punctularia strigosozonata HHB-11173 SS5]